MKTTQRLLALVLAVMIGAGMASAGLRFGLKAGVNVDKMSLSSDLFQKGNECGFTGGVMTEFEVPVIGLCFDLSLMYTRMNSSLRWENLPGMPPVSVKSDHSGSNFLEIPLNLKYKFGLPVVGSIIKPYLFTGPAFAFKLDSHTWGAIKSKRCQVAWNVGLGLELLKHLQIGASYGFGVNNVAKYTIPNVEVLKFKNNYWTVTAAYLF